MSERKILRKEPKEERKLKIVRAACKLFAEKGYYSTTIPDIAEALGMSAGNLYNYFESKEELAKEVMQTTSRLIADKLREINETDLPSKEKIRLMVKNFFEIYMEEPELIDYFLRVFLSNREVFREGCEGFACVGEVVAEIMILLSIGVEREVREKARLVRYLEIQVKRLMLEGGREDKVRELLTDIMFLKRELSMKNARCLRFLKRTLTPEQFEKLKDIALVRLLEEFR
jgi:AcrR family transcriptional regulator